MGLGYIRLEWMPGDREPFEMKAFMLKELAKYHERFCEQGIHHPNEDGSGCKYCAYRHSYIESVSAQDQG